METERVCSVPGNESVFVKDFAEVMKKVQRVSVVILFVCVPQTVLALFSQGTEKQPSIFLDRKTVL